MFARQMPVHQMPGRFVLLTLAAMVLLTACNEGPRDYTSSEVPASAPADRSASS